MADKSKENNNNAGACVVCYKNVDIYSIGMCEHPVCYECSTRMRVLCKQNECPICRQELPKVVFTKDIKPFRHIRRGNLFDGRYNIYFESRDVQEKFIQLLMHTCSICHEAQAFSNFHALKDHMRKKHELHYCDLCVENLKIFSHERRCYSRADLAQHRRKGDPDDKSHKGHPLCEFCDRRYMDNDELFRHLRRDHLYCHFCDADGLHQYYSSYDYLRDHFRQEHYLCEEGPCAEEKFTSVFRSDIDLKAHKASVHGRHLGKAAAKQARTLELEFAFTPRGEARSLRRGPPGPSNSRPRDHVDSRDFQEAETSVYCEPEMRQPDVLSTQEFPSLGNAPPAPLLIPQAKSKGRGNLTIRNSLNPRPLAVDDTNFPALGPESTNNVSKTVNLNVYRGQPTAAQRPQSAAPNVSIQVNHKTNGSITTRVSAPSVRIRPTTFTRDTDFPALGRSEASTSSGITTQWTKVKCVKSTANNSRKKVAPAPVFDSSPRASPSPEDFPSLPKTAKAKKQTSVSVTPKTTASPQSASSSRASIVNDSETNSDTNKANNKKKKKKKAKTPSSGNTSSGNESSANHQENKPSVIDNCDQSKKENQQANTKNKEANAKNKEAKKNQQKNESAEATVNKQPANGIRKRSELKIDSVNNTHNSSRNEEFPALGKSRATNPPPGFNTTPAPPPGFAVKLIGGNGSSTRDNGLTFTNSSGESYSILPDNSKSYTYVPPLDFQKRNKNLVAKISEVLSEQKESLEEFRFLSGLYRQGTLTAEQYYKRCRSAMGADAFREVFPEVLVLLPDISKQRELFDSHKKEVGKVKMLEQCPTCGQVVKVGNDLKSHIASHTLDNEFPALGQATTVQAGNNWVRRGA